MEVTRGSAVLEGIAIASRRWRVAAVRRDGTIYVATAPARFQAIRGIPFLRGLVASFIESPTELQWSGTQTTPLPEQLPPTGIRSPFAMFMMLAWAHGLPQLALYRFVHDPWAFQGAALAIQLAVFLLYLRFIQRVKGMERVFQYAGAFKKALWQLRAPGTTLRDHPRWHWHGSPVTVALGLAIVAALAGVVLPRLALGGWGTLLVRIGLTPIGFALADEIQRVLTKLGHGAAMRILFAPLVFIDRVGTGEPDDEMLEVASACAEKLRSLES
jgi:uncharacterized protein YqhQ